jgi:uncharacterized membrane protein YfcA
MTLPDYTTAALLVVILGLFTGSLVKGVLGAGIPAVGLPIMVMVIDPAQAVTLFLVPVAVSNIWQILESGEYEEALRRFWPFLIMLAVGVWFGAGALTTLDPQVIALALGCVVIVTTLAQIFTPNATFLQRHAAKVNPVAGGLIGICSGATGAFTPIIVYFAAMRLPKNLFVTLLAIAAMLGSAPLYLRLITEGHMSWPQFWASALAMIPVGIGIATGFWIRKRISEAVFRRLVQIGLILLGVMLIWRGMS